MSCGEFRSWFFGQASVRSSYVAALEQFSLQKQPLELPGNSQSEVHAAARSSFRCEANYMKLHSVLVLKLLYCTVRLCSSCTVARSASFEFHRPPFQSPARQSCNWGPKLLTNWKTLRANFHVHWAWRKGIRRHNCEHQLVVLLVCVLQRRISKFTNCSGQAQWWRLGKFEGNRYLCFLTYISPSTRST